MRNYVGKKPLRKKAGKTLPSPKKTFQKISSVGTEKLTRDLEVNHVELGAEEAMRNQNRLIMALEAADMVIWEWDIATRSIRYSENIGTIVHGTAVEPYCSLDSLMPKIHPEDRGSLAQDLDQTAKEGTPFECEYRVQMLDGTYRWILGKGKRVFMEGGKPVRVLGLSMDITERKRDEEERKKYQNLIQEERDRLAALVNSITDEVWFADTQKKFTLANPSALREFGFAMTGNGIDVGNLVANSEVYRTDGSLRPIEEAPPLRSLQGDVIRNEEEIVRTPGKGELRHRQVSSAPVRNSVGNIIGSVSVVRDITDYKKAEAALRESEERLRFALETSHTGAWDLDLLDHTAHRSLEHDRIFGYEQLLPQWTYEMFLDHVLPEDRAAVDAKFRQAVKNQSDWSFECRIRRSDGEIRWIWAAGRHWTDTEGKARRMAGIVQDITERKQAERKLEESERLYRAIGESIDYGIWVCDPEGRNIYASESFLNLVGITQDQCSDLGWGDVLHPEDAGGTIAAWKECVTTGGKWDIEHRYRGTDGKWHPILARGVPVRDEQGKVICWAGINLDISGLKKMEEDLRKSRDELEKRVQERTEELMKSQNRLQQLSSQLLLAQEKERKRVAVELHDGLLSELAATKYLLEGKIMLLEKGKLSEPGEFRRVVDILASAMKEARRIMNNLHPSILDELGLITALNWLSGEYHKSYPHIVVLKKMEVGERDIPDSLKVVIY
ncbi:MAG: sensory transduction histidine kinase, partial [Deltaproteobacteria bacterium]|nr:sensory transduction histidine kinase [Deltaproteobacteria bacterium]